MKQRKTIENSLLIVLFVFASFGAYVVFANSGKKPSADQVNQPSLYMKSDYSKYNTVKPQTNKREAVPTETVQ